MPMTHTYIDQMKRLMEWEAARTAPPEGFPRLPDLPAGRYRSEEHRLNSSH